jgi:hypothetical protein
VLHLKHRAEQSAAPAAGVTRAISEPVAGAPAQVTLFEASDKDGVLYPRTATIPLPEERGRRARDILRALVAQYQQGGSQHPLAPAAEVVAVYLVNDNLAIVDVSAGFAEGHCSGILVEELTLASMAKTLAANLPGITRMKLLVEGQERATLSGHADLIEPYDVTAADALVKQ